MSAREPAAAVAKGNRSEERPPSMRDLLASCAAADAVSTPPKAPEPRTPPQGERGEATNGTNGTNGTHGGNDGHDEPPAERDAA